MSNLLLRDAGEALYGPRWQSDLARAIGVSDRTMRRWVAGDGAPPAGVWVDIHRLLAERQVVIGELQSRTQTLMLCKNGLTAVQECCT